MRDALKQFDTWLDDLQLYLLSDSRDSVLLFDHTSGAAPAPPAIADNATRSQWLTCDAAARLAIRNHLPLAECTHFGQHRTAQALYDAVVTRYSSPATAALGCLLLPYLFPKLSAFATVEDLVSHLRTGNACYRVAAPAKFLGRNQPPMFITLYFIVTSLPDSLRSVRDQFLSLDPTVLTVDLLEQHLLAAETSVVDVGAARGTPRTPFFEGCSPSPLAPSYASVAAVDVPVADDVRAVVAVDASVAASVWSIEAAALGASDTTLTPLSAPVPVRLADPSGGPVVTRSSTALPCPAVPFGSLSCLHLPSFAMNLVSTAALQDVMDTTTTPGGQRVSICTCTRTGRHLATFTRRPGSSLYTLATKPPQVAASAQVSASGQVAPPCSCHLLSHQTLQWHHRLGHPSLPRLCGMHSRLLASGLPRSLPPLPPSPAPPCLPCVEGRQRAASPSSFPPTNTSLQTLHMDMWGPARISGQGRERYFLLVVDDYTRYTTVFPLHSKGEDLLVLRLHSDRGGEFSSDLLRDFCRGEGITQSFTLPASPQQNGIAEHRIGLVMEVARTSMIHAAAPHLLWPFAVWYAVHKLNLWPRVSLPETSPTLRWTGKVGDASMFRFYHPTSCHVLTPLTLDESVPFYCLFPYHSAPSPPPPLFLVPGPPPVDPLPPQGPAPSGLSQVDPLLGALPVEVAGDSGAARGAASGGVGPGCAEPGGAESKGAGSGGAEPGGC
ncbi:unnamed protein product [Closterium sp. NIES-53]